MANFRLLARVNDNSQVASTIRRTTARRWPAGLYLSQFGGVGTLHLVGNAQTGTVGLWDNGDGTFGVGYGGQQYTYNAAQVAAI